METFTKQKFWAELEELGEDGVRERLIGKIYSSANHKKELAEEWLRVQEGIRSEIKENEIRSQNKESIDISRSAKNAAWVAAVCAAIAILISIAAICISISK
jgi:hypothetical protein